VDDDEVAWARAILLRTRQPTPNEKVRAYRILTAAHPGAYRRELARALAERGFVYGSGVALEDRLALLEEAADAARAVADSEPGRAELVVRVLDMYQMTLGESGLWPQVLAIREEMSVVSRAWPVATDFLSRPGPPSTPASTSPGGCAPTRVMLAGRTSSGLSPIG
jgi:hypothetical protein